MARAFELDLELLGASPRVWRRLRAPADLSLADLHRAIQVVMRWDDVHPHVFDVAGREYGPEPDEEEVSLHWAGDDRDVTLATVVKNERVFEYTYDFGAEQRVLITVDDQITAGPARLECLDGDGARFDAADINDRLSEEFRGAGRGAAAMLTPEGRLLADLTLLVLFLTSFEEGKGTRVANKTFRLETLDTLGDQGLVVTNVHRKSVELTPAGVRRAEALFNRVVSLLGQ